MATKNLGQASAIISKSTAPTNTKVIWRDTSVVPAEHKVWDGTQWVKVKVDFFTDLEDSPNSYINEAGKVLVVNQTEDGLEFAIQSGGIEEAPNDGQQYVRQSGGWAVITVTGGYTSADFDIDFSNKTTDDLTEGNNKFISQAELDKLSGIENNATADQTGAEIKTAYENEANTNAFTDDEKTKLIGIEEGAEVNPTIEQTRSQSTTSVPSSKLLDDELGVLHTELSAFSPVLDLSKNTTIRHTVGGAINFTLGANPVLGKKAIFYLVADGLNTPTFGTGFVEKFNNYDNTINKVNRLYFEYVGNNTVLYEVTYV
jgi:hypothetical protein